MSSIPYTHMQMSVNKLGPFSGPNSTGTEKNKLKILPWTSLKVTSKQSLTELIRLRKKLGHSKNSRVLQGKKAITCPPYP